MAGGSRLVGVERLGVASWVGLTGGARLDVTGWDWLGAASWVRVDEGGQLGGWDNYKNKAGSYVR